MATIEKLIDHPDNLTTYNVGEITVEDVLQKSS